MTPAAFSHDPISSSLASKYQRDAASEYIEWGPCDDVLVIQFVEMDHRVGLKRQLEDNGRQVEHRHRDGAPIRWTRSEFCEHDTG